MIYKMQKFEVHLGIDFLGYFLMLLHYIQIILMSEDTSNSYVCYRLIYKKYTTHTILLLHFI